ncbi:MAG: inositol monophosphatase [Devosia nanyangense]|uniref:Inositol monophosphatase n=1 Tax=Devosia nanyangense TaxID=1228055 RepID=A0A933KXN1_9HYPH|nr:inositol monophosphatase [Devosia nanyangense]
MTIDILELAAILRDVAAREILPRFRRLEPDSVRTKSNPTDLVTEADTEAERVIKVEIAKRWPDALVVGEESVAEDPGLLHRLLDADLAITLDPVDGTANFAAGLPLFAVMASVVVRREVVGGIIYDPMGDDWVMAERGAGAWMRHPDGWNKRLDVAAPVPLDQMVGTVSMGFLDKATKPQVLANLAKIAIPANYRVAGHDYRSLASGHTQFATFNKLMPWDHLPGTLICAEAGAHVAHFDGTPYRVGDLSGGLLLATSRESWSLLRREVFTV